MPFSNEGKSVQRIWFTENNDRIFEDKRQNGRTGPFTKKIWGPRITDHPKAQEQPSETRVYWRERDRCGWTGKLTKPGSPDTNTSFNTPDIQRKGLTQCSIRQTIHHDLSTCLLSIIVSFSYIYVSQGSVPTQLRCSGIFNNHRIAPFPQNVPVKEFWKSVNTRRSCVGNDMWEVFWGDSVRCSFN